MLMPPSGDGGSGALLPDGVPGEPCAIAMGCWQCRRGGARDSVGVLAGQIMCFCRNHHLALAKKGCYTKGRRAPESDSRECGEMGQRKLSETNAHQGLV
jgi:hypothetical protein